MNLMEVRHSRSGPGESRAEVVGLGSERGNYASFQLEALPLQHRPGLVRYQPVGRQWNERCANDAQLYILPGGCREIGFVAESLAKRHESEYSLQPVTHHKYCNQPYLWSDRG